MNQTTIPVSSERTLSHLFDQDLDLGMASHLTERIMCEATVADAFT